MASIRERTNGTFELRVVHRNLPKPNYSTHDTEIQAKAYGEKLKAALDSGYMPPELLEKAEADVKLFKLLGEYMDRGRVSSSDRPMVEFLRAKLDMNLGEVTVRWVDDWILGMKRKEHLAPGTIRKRVESLARGIDWWNRGTGQNRMNPLRGLPVGYSSYSDGEQPEGKGAKLDQKRDRRLRSGEEEAIIETIRGIKRDDRQRPLAIEDSDQFEFFFTLIINTGLRLREAYSLRWQDISTDKRLIHVAMSKTGAKRDVPMLPVVLRGFLQTRSGIPREPRATVFDFWDGSEADKIKTTRRLSAQFARLFDYAGCSDITEHDLRHEATCRWMLMRDDRRGWLYRPEEVRRITGHKNVQLFERYLSLHGSDLADRLWEGQESLALPSAT